MNVDTTQLLALQTGAAQMGIVLGEQQQQKMLAYLALMSKWNKVYNLTALRDPAKMMTHHLLDSLAVVPAFTGAKRILDVGAGGGLPGIILAIWAQQQQPEMTIDLVDTVHKKTAFLTQVKAQLQLDNVHVHTGRVEELALSPYDVITSRAFAELKDFIDWSHHLLEDGGKYIALKGVVPEDEIARLPAGWHVEEIIPVTVPGLDAQRHLIIIRKQ